MMGVDQQKFYSVINGKEYKDDSKLKTELEIKMGY
jgi:hypothetical protein